MKMELHDPLMNLGDGGSSNMGELAEVWGGRLLKLTLLLTFVDIGVVIVFLLTMAEILPRETAEPILQHWKTIAWCTTLPLAGACVAALLKVVNE